MRGDIVMLINFSLQNFKSFDKETELSMIPSAESNLNKGDIAKINGIRVLKYSVIYGANASGKSNWIKGIEFFRDVVRQGLSLRASSMFCKTKKENSKNITRFEMQFSIDNYFYAYGFSVVLSKREICDEWLYQLYTNGKAQRIYERKANGEVVLDKTFLSKLSEREKERITVYQEDFTGDKDQLFLTFMNQEKKYISKSAISIFQKIYRWITRNIIVVVPDKNFSDMSYYNDERSLKEVNKIIKNFDTGISQVEMRRSSFEEMEEVLPPVVFSDVKKEVKKGMQRKSDSFRLTMRSKDIFFSIRCSQDNIRVDTLRFRHEKSDFDFLFSEESDGTRRLFDFLDMILSKRKDVVYIIDELDRSLHPRMTEFYLRQFMKYNNKKNNQFVFTTHEASIMDLSLFRRDEIWFVERDAESTSRLYSLDQFRERYDDCLSQAYLDGRYGAIPALSSYDWMEENGEWE